MDKREAARQRGKNKVRVVEACKSAWHSLNYAKAYTPKDEPLISILIDSAQDGIEALQEAARRMK